MGELRINAPQGNSVISVGAQAAAEGILIGRYDRCDSHNLRTLSSDLISRVHLLVLDVSGILYAIDTASSNGSWIGETEARVTRLEYGTTLTLANEDTRVEWRALH